MGEPPAGESLPPSRSASAHLLDVARCPIVERCLPEPDPRHPCAKIVLDQWRGISSSDRLVHWRETHQLPEPWVGHLERAPILFVSSNPSIAGSVTIPPTDPPPFTAEISGHTAVDHPSMRRLGAGTRWTWSDEELVDRCEAAFDIHIANGIAGRRPDGSAGPFTRFWAAVRRRAQELLPDRPVRPGLDYALTEVVRCKSRRERGVAEALETCSSLYLDPTLELSGARVIVVLGRVARRVVAPRVGSPEGNLHGPLVVGGTERLVAFLPHPNARERRSFAHCLTPEDLERVRAQLR
jgi:hypothetical protein